VKKCRSQKYRRKRGVEDSSEKSAEVGSAEVQKSGRQKGFKDSRGRGAKFKSQKCRRAEDKKDSRIRGFEDPRIVVGSNLYSSVLRLRQHGY
jgi:hypothetical protein